MKREIIATDKSQEGVYQESLSGAIYIFYKAEIGDKVRLDVFEGKKIDEVEDFKNYQILECSDEYNPDQERTTYYLMPKKGVYTDSLGTTYKTSSMYVYTDKNGNYRTFSDDTKKHIQHHEKQLEDTKKYLEKAKNSPFGDHTKDIEMYERWIKMHEKQLEKFRKDLSKGL